MKNIGDSFWRVLMFLDDIIYVIGNISKREAVSGQNVLEVFQGWLLQARRWTNSEDIRFPFLLVSCCLKENRKNLFPKTLRKRLSSEKVPENFSFYTVILWSIQSYEFTANLSTGRRRRRRVDNLVARAWIAAKSASLWKLQPGYCYFRKH